MGPKWQEAGSLPEDQWQQSENHRWPLSWGRLGAVVQEQSSAAVHDSKLHEFSSKDKPIVCALGWSGMTLKKTEIPF